MSNSESSTLRFALEVLKSLSPGMGLVVDQLIERHSAESNRIAQDSFSRRVKRLENRMREPASIDQQALAEAIKLCWPVVWQTHNQERIDAATALMVNPLLKDTDPERLEREELDFFARALAQLSNDALRILTSLEPAPKKEGAVLRSARDLGQAVGMDADRALARIIR